MKRRPRTSVHIYQGPMLNESRIFKETRAIVDRGLADRCLLIAFWEPGLRETEEMDSTRCIWRVRLRARSLPPGIARSALALLEWYLRILVRLARERVTAVHAHSIFVLPLGALLRLLKRAPLVYDAHELETETLGMRGARQRIAKRAERALMRFVDWTIVVTPSIAAWYREAYGTKRVTTIRNIPERRNLPAGRGGKLRARIGARDGDLLFLYLGSLAPGRGVELLLEACERLPEDRRLVFLGSGSLEGAIREAAGRHRNVHHVPSVPTHEVLEYAVDADVGLTVADGDCLSYRYSLSNKFFEYLMCGLPVIVSEHLVAMREILEPNRAGWTMPVAPLALAEFLGGLSPSEVRDRAANARAVGERLSWDAEITPLVDIYGSIGAHRPAGPLARSTRDASLQP
jgi:glycosyltransferase involved in cell wall biosynthesis